MPPLKRDVYKNSFKLRTEASLNDVFRKEIDLLKKAGLLFDNDFALKTTLLMEVN